MKDKILVWLSPDLSYFCISQALKKKYDCDLYAIIDITDKPKKFFQEQDLVKFEKTWFFHDNIEVSKKSKPDLDYLSNFEKKYEIDIWKLAINERIFYRFFNFYNFTDDEILSIDEQACKFFEAVLGEVKPDFLITMEPKFHHLEIFYEMCRKIGIKVLIMSFPNVGYRGIISEEPNVLDKVHDINKVQPQNRTFEDLQSYVKSLSLLKQQQTFDKKHGGTKNAKIIAGMKFFLSTNSNVNNHYNYFGRTKFKVLLYTVSSVLQKYYRQRFIDTNLKREIPKNQPFIYFPLGVDMERNLLIQAPFFTNQIELIRNIAKSTPVGYKIFVKENPAQVSREWRSISEYREIMKIPNVELFHPGVKNEELLKNCELVTTIAGTSGFEAAIYGKPSVVFSNIYYSILPSVSKVKNLSELPKKIRDALNTKVLASDVDRYLTFYHNNSFEYDWLSFATNYLDYFYYSGNLVDVDIPVSKMHNFINQNNQIIEKITEKHIEKILEYKKLKS